MRSLAAILTAVLVLTAAATAYAESIPDTAENRKAAAERYLAAVPPDDLSADFIREVVKGVPEGQQADVARLLQDFVRVEVISRAMLEAMLKHFTAEELNALASFYGSPVGRAISKKFGTYSVEILPAIHAEVARAVREFQSRQRSR